VSYKVAINGFGRIGRNFLRSSIDQDYFEVIAINDITSAKTLAHLLKYDSVFGRFEKEVRVCEGAIVVNKREIKIFSERDPENLPWKDLGIDLVVESTGLFRDRESAGKHIRAGAKKVVISAKAYKSWSKKSGHISSCNRS
jgi:glyceraldehyde 3-phosphate dehydrogenase